MNEITAHSQFFFESHPDNLSRKFPPYGFADTVIGHRNAKGEMVIQSIHGQHLIFQNEEIVTEHAVIRKEFLQGSEIAVGFTEHGKPIIQQQGVRGCTAATAAMLIYEHGGEVNIDGMGGLQWCNLGTMDSIVRTIDRAGFLAIRTLCANSLASLEEVLQKGSAIVSIEDPTAGGHSIIVDEISLEGVRIRDPYHAWEITVTPKAFLQRWVSAEIVQLAKSAT